MNYETPYDGMQQYAYPAQYPYPAQPGYAPQQYGPQQIYAQPSMYRPQYNPYENPYAPQQQYPQQQQMYAQQQQMPVYPQPAAAPQQMPDPYAGWDEAPGWGGMDTLPGMQEAQHAANPWGTMPEQQAETADIIDAPEQAAEAPCEKAKDNWLKKFLHREEKPDTAGKKLLRFGTNIAFWLICIALVGGSVLFMLNNDPNKNYFGYRAYGVRSNSMAPNADGSSPPGGFLKGDTIIVQMCHPQQIQEGDIVTFCPNPNDPESTAYLTHRVVKILDELGGKQGLYFVTKGDHNKSEDPPIAGNAIIGKKVATIPKMGMVLELVRGNLVIAVIMLVALFGTILMLQWYFTKPTAKPQKARKPKKGAPPEPGSPELTPQPLQAAPGPIQSVLPG